MTGELQEGLLRFVRMLKLSRTLLLLRERWNVIRNRIWPSFAWEHLTTIQEGGTSAYLEEAYWNGAGAVFPPPKARRS